MSPAATIDHAHEMRELARRARAAWRGLLGMDAEARAGALRAMARGIEVHAERILSANKKDVDRAIAGGLTPAMIDRLLLTPERVAGMARGVREVAALPDPLGRVEERVTRPNGLVIEKTRCALGVALIIYESRPNVTADAAALCFKAGSCAILRGGSESARSNSAILDAMLGGAREVGAGVPEGAIQLVPTTDRAAVSALLALEDLIDLVIPRGGEGLIRAVAEQSRAPVLKHYKGVCHVYVDREADLDMAQRIAMNAKVSRPGVCNAMETLLVHADVAEGFLPAFARAAIEAGVELRGDERTRALVPGAKPATEEDWRAEYLDLILAVRVVEDLDAAIEHIETFGSRHTDVIVTRDEHAAERFLREVDSATVYVNASSRFTDGAEFGKGAEIGVSTDKLHARGPCGVEELTTYKYIVRGAGQVRE